MTVAGGIEANLEDMLVILRQGSVRAGVAITRCLAGITFNQLDNTGGHCLNMDAADGVHRG